jgi:hypothetical protein
MAGLGLPCLGTLEDLDLDSAFTSLPSLDRGESWEVDTKEENFLEIASVR